MMSDINWNAPYLDRRTWILNELGSLNISAEEALALLLIDFLNEQGQLITHEILGAKLHCDSEQIDELYKKREQLLKQQAIYDVGSDKYDDYAEQIADIDDEIYGLLGDIEDLKDKIWEVRWQPFFDGMEAAEVLP